MRFDKIDWQGDHVTIIGRVMERGNDEEVKEMVRFYGEDKVIFALKNEITYLPEHTKERVCN